MNPTVTNIKDVPELSRSEAKVLASTEYERFIAIIRSLEPDAWSQPTDCPEWDVRLMAAHVLGTMESNASVRVLIHQRREGNKVAGDRPAIDGQTEVQVRERAHLSPEQLINGIVEMAPRAAKGRAKVPGMLRRLPMKVEFAGATETWKLGYLLDPIFTRDTWMHRVDIARATGAELVLTPEHDGRIVADVVAEWARRDGQPFTLHLEGAAGGSFTTGIGGEQITVDAVEFCRMLSGRATGGGLLTQEVPF